MVVFLVCFSVFLFCVFSVFFLLFFCCRFYSFFKVNVHWWSLLVKIGHTQDNPSMLYCRTHLNKVGLCFYDVLL